MKKSLFMYVLMWLIWAIWSVIILPQLPVSPFIEILSQTAVKALVWVVPLFVFTKRLKSGELFAAKFPWLPCVVFLCITVSFLYTLRVINGLQNTYVVFDPVFIVTSVSAGVFEELSFRGGLYAEAESDLGFWRAAVINAAMFTLYHYPGLLTGEWSGLISLRSLLIFVMGFVFCWMFKKWKNLALNMTVHTVWDILSYLFCLAG